MGEEEKSCRFGNHFLKLLWVLSFHDPFPRIPGETGKKIRVVRGTIGSIVGMKIGKGVVAIFDRG